MGEDKKLDAMTDGELEEIVGGEGKLEYGDNGEFKCPKCGYTNDFHLVVDKWGVKAYGRP